MWPFRHEPCHWYPCSRLDYYSTQLMARHTKAIQGLLQNLTASTESTTSSLSTRISLSASTWRNRRPAKPKAVQAASQLAGPKVSNWKGGKLCPCRRQNSNERIWEGSRSWARLPLHLKFNGFWHITKHSSKFLRRSEGLSAVKSYSDYRLQMNRKSIPHHAAASVLQYSLYSCVGVCWARPLKGQEA